jgi:hypothetical protein
MFSQVVNSFGSGYDGRNLVIIDCAKAWVQVRANAQRNLPGARNGSRHLPIGSLSPVWHKTLNHAAGGQRTCYSAVLFIFWSILSPAACLSTLTRLSVLASILLQRSSFEWSISCSYLSRSFDRNDSLTILC